jgi:hypothetical protein
MLIANNICNRKNNEKALHEELFGCSEASVEVGQDCGLKRSPLVFSRFTTDVVLDPTITKSILCLDTNALLKIRTQAHWEEDVL